MSGDTIANILVVVVGVVLVLVALSPFLLIAMHFMAKSRR